MQIRSTAINRFNRVRAATEEICKPLEIEDHTIQPIEDVSPPKWHLGHTSWFFETFILIPYKQNYRKFSEHYNFIFNSYYENAGERIQRVNRGNLSRPTLDEVMEYRRYIDNEIEALFEAYSSDDERPFFLLELGCQHEQQHQELLYTDIKYILGNNPLFPAYLNLENKRLLEKSDLTEKFNRIEEGVYEIGYGGNEFFYDNEKGVHKVFLHEFEIMDRLISNGEYLEFIDAGGYNDFDLWLSDGWAWIKENNVIAPEYWQKIGVEWSYYTMNGLRKLDMYAPVTHISFYEAEAFARWKGMRLPTEFEWETAARMLNPSINKDVNLGNQEILSPAPKVGDNDQMYGDCWEWTNSSYLPYPYYRKDDGALGEYNAKFMIDQMVLRGGSCVTPFDHIRPTYRNFFQSEKRWQFTGIRLARTIDK